MPGQDAVCRAGEDVPVVWGEQPQPCAALLGVYTGVLFFAEMGLPKLMLDVTKNPQWGPGEAAMDTDGHRQTPMVTDGHQWTPVDTGGRWGTRPLFCLILARQCRNALGCAGLPGRPRVLPGAEGATLSRRCAGRGRHAGELPAAARGQLVTRSLSPNVPLCVTKHAVLCHQTFHSVSPNVPLRVTCARRSPALVSAGVSPLLLCARHVIRGSRETYENGGQEIFLN